MDDVWVVKRYDQYITALSHYHLMLISHPSNLFTVEVALKHLLLVMQFIFWNWPILGFYK